MERKYISLDKQGVENFKLAYLNALIDNKEFFEFEGHSFLTTYAKYLIEHIGDKIKGDNNE